MRRYVVTTIVLFAALLVPRVAFAGTAAPPAESGIDNLVRSFIAENAPGFLPPDVAAGRANTDTPRTSYGGESQHDPAKADTVVIEDRLTAIVNPTHMPQFVPGLMPGPIVRAGTESTPGAPTAAPFVWQPFGEPFTTPTGLIPPAEPVGVTTLDEFVQRLGGTDGVDFRILRTMGTEAGIPADGPVVLHGMRVRGPLPLDNDCGGDLYELGSAFLLDGGMPWPMNPSFPEDIFIGASDAVVGRCRPGVGWYIDTLRNTGSSFQSLDPAASASIGVVTENAIVIATPLSALPGLSGSRGFAFTTPDPGGYQPGNTAHTVTEFPGLTPVTRVPILVDDPFPGEPRMASFPLTIRFSGDNDPSVCGPPEWSGLFELHVGEGPGPAYPAHLYQFESGQVTVGSIQVDPAPIMIDTAGGGSGYTETFALGGGSGTYTYTPGDASCPLTATVVAGWDAVEGYGWPSFASPSASDGTDTGTSSSSDGSTDGDGGAAIVTDTSPPVIAVPTGGDAGSDGNLVNYGLIGGGLLLAGGGYAYERRRRADFHTLQSGVDEPASAQLSVEDLAQYNEFGVSAPVSEARDAARLDEQQLSTMVQAEAHAESVAADKAAAEQARQTAFAAQLSPPPRRRSNVYLTDNPVLAFAFAFVEDFENGNARDRLVTFVETVPDAGEALVDNTVRSLETAYNGWGEIIDDPSKLGGIDEGVVATADQLGDLGSRYIAAASADDGGQEFARMTSHLTVNLEAMAISHRVMVAGKNALVNRLGGVPAATAESAGVGTEAGASAGRAGASAGRAAPRTPPRPSAPRPRPGGTRPRTPPPVDPDAPTVVNGYGPAYRGAPVRGGGTPMQAHPMGCGAAVVRGILNDLGLRVLPELQILREGFMLGVWEGTGLSLRGALKVLDKVLPSGMRLAAGTFRGVGNAAQRIGHFLGRNPRAAVMAGLRWNGKFAGGAGHFVRVEAVRNGWVILGDPQWGAGVSVAIPIARFNQLAEVVITVMP